MTPAEKLLWANLRRRKFQGLKFLRQHPIIHQVYHNKPDYFIAGFYCAEKKLVIEVDGKIHDFQKEQDQHRNNIMGSLNLHVLRIKNEDVENVSQVLQKIRDFIVSIE